MNLYGVEIIHKFASYARRIGNTTLELQEIIMHKSRLSHQFVRFTYVVDWNSSLIWLITCHLNVHTLLQFAQRSH